MKFLLDENVHKGLFSFLLKLGHDVKLSPKIIKNGEVFALALKEERLLVSRDEDFIKSLYKSSEHFGIWLLRIPPKDLEQQKRAVANLLSSEKEFKGKIIRLLSDKEFVEE